jgi:hypothetical protein
LTRLTHPLLLDIQATTTLQLIDLATSEIRPITAASQDGTPYEPLFLDDNHLAFLQARDDLPHVYVLDLESQELYQLTDFPVEISSLKYNAASQLLGFAAAVYEDGDLAVAKAQDESRESAKKDSGLAYDSLQVRFWNTYLPSKEKKNNIFVISIALEDSKYVLKGSAVNLLVGTGLVSNFYLLQSMPFYCKKKCIYTLS